jgi:hypothetical protein
MMIFFKLHNYFIEEITQKCAYHMKQNTRASLLGLAGNVASLTVTPFVIGFLPVYTHVQISFTMSTDAPARTSPILTGSTIHTCLLIY